MPKNNYKPFSVLTNRHKWKRVQLVAQATIDGNDDTDMSQIHVSDNVNFTAIECQASADVEYCNNFESVASESDSDTSSDGHEFELGDFSQNLAELPLSKSSSQMWPILLFLEDYPAILSFVVGMYHGHEKSNSWSEYLDNFVNDMIELKT
ncbi:hypothetical protein J437_LFUL019521 [Ladona fulva]|uniref:Uncharacterized protein n=1 Tax=Ladona fulva TaxID=123851 RepID=A0A8K0KR36_LADFU|nr:hypothetical protein J437_LFUL019521 [Ladona fulva]